MFVRTWFKDLNNQVGWSALIAPALAQNPLLTQLGAEAIFGYTTKLYYWHFNQALRSGSSNPGVLALKKTLMDALGAMPLAIGDHFRGLRLVPDQLAAFDARYQVGNEIDVDSFLSTGPSAEESYQDQSPRKLIIRTLSGRNITQLAFGPNFHAHPTIRLPIYNSEWIIPPGPRLKVMKSDVRTGLIWLEEIK
jgi:hypothetical protein